MKTNKKEIMLSILGLMSLVLITSGVSYAFFNYAKQGTTENTVTTGTITFIYEEVEAQGAGIGISDAYPISDDAGKAQSGSGKVFNFSVKSKTMNDVSIPYTVTARMKADSTLDQSTVKLYLTEVSGDEETEILLNTYDKLGLIDNAPDGVVERVIHTDTVPKGSTNYQKDFRLRMWIPDTINFSPNEDGTYPYNGKTFTITINVYANANVVTTPTEPTTMTSSTALSIGDSVTATDGSKWHVLEASASGVETVVLLSDYNLNTDGTYNTECGGEINSTYKCSPMAFDEDNTNTYDENDSNNIGYFIKNTYEPLVTATLSGTTNVTLPTAEQIASADGQTFNNKYVTLTNSWLATTQYWTKNATNSTPSYVWTAGSSQLITGNFDASNSTGYGARPVITTLKTNLLAE